MEESLPGARARSAAQRDAADVETRARELLAAEIEAEGLLRLAYPVRNNSFGKLDFIEQCAIRALSTALTSSREGALREAERIRALEVRVVELEIELGINEARNAEIAASAGAPMGVLEASARATKSREIPTPQEQA